MNLIPGVSLKAATQGRGRAWPITSFGWTASSTGMLEDF